MSHIHQYLGSQVLRSPTKGKSPSFCNFSEAKISEFEVSISSYQNIFGLEVTIDNVLVMQVFEDRNYLRCIESKYV